MWQQTDDGPVVAILTTKPNETMAELHHRMPVVLSSEKEQAWLTAAAAERQQLARPYQGRDLTAVPISTRVNDPANDDPSIIKPIETDQTGLDDF